MKELKSKLLDLAMQYENMACETQDQDTTTWYQGIAMGLRRAVIELKEVT